MTDGSDIAPKKRCFVITPIGGDQSDERRHANMVFEVALKDNLESANFTVERADLTTDPGQITSAIFSAINQSELCIADLTFLNANVMYELGVRHALQKPVIQIAENGTRLPFDAANQRTLFFDSRDVHSLKKLGSDVMDQVKWIEGHPGKISNPLTAALGTFENAVSADPQAEIISQLDARVKTLELGRIAPAITGQGDLATKNTQDLRRLWRADQIAESLDWREEKEGMQIAQYRGFDICVAPESKGRWSSSAVEKSSGYSVPWPIWQPSADDAKATIVRSVEAVLSERSD